MTFLGMVFGVLLGLGVIVFLYTFQWRQVNSSFFSPWHSLPPCAASLAMCLPRNLRPAPGGPQVLEHWLHWPQSLHWQWTERNRIVG